MRITSFKSQADKCRRLASEHSDVAQSVFLLRVAGAFEALTTEPRAPAAMNLRATR